MHARTKVRYARWVMPLLCTSVLCLCVGHGALAFMYGSTYNSFVFLNLGYAETTAIAWDRGLAIALMLAGVLTCMRRTRLAALLVSLWLVGSCAFKMYYETWYPLLMPGSHALRICLPLIVCAAWTWRTQQRLRLLWCLRIMAASVFFFHGCEAVLLRGNFLDMLIRFFGYESPLAYMQGLLVFIGVSDMLLACAVVLPIPKKTLCVCLSWMALWGLLTALARVVVVDVSYWPDMLIRITHGIVPLIALILLMSEEKEAEGQQEQVDTTGILGV